MGKQFRIVEVAWEDSNVARGWQSTKEATKGADERPLYCRSVGYVLGEEKGRRISLVQSLGQTEESMEGSVTEVITIPWKSILQIVEYSAHGKKKEK